MDNRELEEFREKGFVIVRGLLAKGEVARVLQFMETDKEMRGNAFDLLDKFGTKVQMALWNNVPDNVCGVLARSEKVAGRMEKFLDGEVYHYHTKLSMKEPHSGGAIEWHQDYGYWYLNAALYPDMGSVYIAMDKSNKENGCLQVIEGSSKLGRIDHIKVGNQVTADPERIALIQSQLQTLYVDMEPGDAVFFHCNTLHQSDPNLSEFRRWGLIIAYNRATNNPLIKHHHSLYEPLIKVPDSEIMTCPLSQGSTERWFLKDRNSEDNSLIKISEKMAA